MVESIDVVVRRFSVSCSKNVADGFDWECLRVYGPNGNNLRVDYGSNYLRCMQNGWGLVQC